MRERPEDIEPLARNFLRKFGLQMGKAVLDFDRDVLDVLKRYPWPGNVRELENAVEYAVAVSGEHDGRVCLEHLPQSVTGVALSGETTVADSHRKGWISKPEWRKSKSSTCLLPCAPRKAFELMLRNFFACPTGRFDIMPRNTTSEAGELDAESHLQPTPLSEEPERREALFSGQNIDRFAIPLLIAFSLALYIATTAYDLVGDDAILIGGNPYVRSFHFLREIFTQNFWSFRGARGDSIYYRPLVMFSFLVQTMLFGPRPGPFHLFNVFLNAWVVVLVYQLGKRFWPKGSGALWAALLFAALPVHTEDVATVSGISDLECAAFFLLALLIYTKPVPAEEAFRGSGRG